MNIPLDQPFSTGGTRTPRGTPAVVKGYAGKNIVAKYNTNNPTFFY